MLLVFALTLAGDLGGKSWAFSHVAGAPVTLDRDLLISSPDFNPIPLHEPMPILVGRVVSLRLAINRGAVFGFGAGQRIFFILFTALAMLAGLVVFARQMSDRSHVAHVAMGLALAGAVGNFYDRIVYGAVRDFLHLLPGRSLPFGWSWPGGRTELSPWVFNVADVLLFVGLVLLIFQIDRRVRVGRRSARAPRSAGAQDALESGIEPDDAVSLRSASSSLVRCS